MLDPSLANPVDRPAPRPPVHGSSALIRGPIVDWYPYPFPDPRDQEYLQPATALTALAVNAVGRLGARRRYGDDR